MRRRGAGAVPRTEIVTGERLQALADVSIVPGHVERFHRHLERFASETATFESYDELDERAIARIADRRVLFVYTHELDAFVEHVWPRLTGGPYVLMTHNSDHGVDASRLPWIEAQGDRLAGWFAQNLEVLHPKLSPLPIGIANSMWKHGNLRTLHRVMASTAAREPQHLVFLHFNPKTHPARMAVWETLRGGFPELAREPPPSRGFRRYLRELASHRFAVCPRGNGADTHRMWECLYLGVVPILERSVHTEMWERQGLPVLLVDAWSDVTPERLEAESARFPRRPAAALAPLTLSHYARSVRAAAQASPAVSGTAWVDPAR